MAVSLGNLPLDVLYVILGNFCAHCRRERLTLTQNDKNSFFGIQQEYAKKLKPPIKTRSRSKKARQGAIRAGSDKEKQILPWRSLGVTSLASLCLVSKNFCALTQPILYHEFTLGYGNPWHSFNYTWERRLCQFVLTVSSRPDLAELVKRVYISHHVLPPFSANKSIQSTIETAVTNLGKTLPRRWRSRPELVESYTSCVDNAMSDLVSSESTWPASDARGDLIALMSAVLPNLEHLIIAAEWVPRNHNNSDTIHSLFRGSNTSLKTLDLCNPYRNVQSLLRIAQGLEALHLHDCRGHWTLDDDVSDLSFPLLETLSITHSFMSLKSLRQMLRAIKGPLSTFTFEAPFLFPMRASQELIDGAYEPCQPSTVVPALAETHRSTLKRLHLDWQRAAPVTEHICSLAALDAVEDLTLSAVSLHRHAQIHNMTKDERLAQVLPKSVVSLSLRGHDFVQPDYIAEELVNLAEAKLRNLRQLPNLQNVQCDARLNQCHIQVGDVLRAAGISFQYATCPLTDPASFSEWGELSWNSGQMEFTQGYVPTEWEHPGILPIIEQRERESNVFPLYIMPLPDSDFDL